MEKYYGYDGSELFLDDDGFYRSKTDDYLYILKDNQLIMLRDPMSGGELEKYDFGFFYSPYTDYYFMLKDDNKLDILQDPFCGGKLKPVDENKFYSVAGHYNLIYYKDLDVLVPDKILDLTREESHREGEYLVGNNTGRKFKLGVNGFPILLPHFEQFVENKDDREAYRRYLAEEKKKQYEENQDSIDRRTSEFNKLETIQKKLLDMLRYRGDKKYSFSEVTKEDEDNIHDNIIQSINEYKKEKEELLLNDMTYVRLQAVKILYSKLVHGECDRMDAVANLDLGKSAPNMFADIDYKDYLANYVIYNKYVDKIELEPESVMFEKEKINHENKSSDSSLYYPFYEDIENLIFKLKTKGFPNDSIIYMLYNQQISEDSLIDFIDKYNLHTEIATTYKKYLNKDIYNSDDNFILSYMISSGYDFKNGNKLMHRLLKDIMINHNNDNLTVDTVKAIFSQAAKQIFDYNCDFLYSIYPNVVLMLEKGNLNVTYQDSVDEILGASSTLYSSISISNDVVKNFLETGDYDNLTTVFHEVQHQIQRIKIQNNIITEAVDIDILQVKLLESLNSKFCKDNYSANIEEHNANIIGELTTLGFLNQLNIETTSDHKKRVRSELEWKGIQSLLYGYTNGVDQQKYALDELFVMYLNENPEWFSSHRCLSYKYKQNEDGTFSLKSFEDLENDYDSATDDISKNIIFGIGLKIQNEAIWHENDPNIRRI